MTVTVADTHRAIEAVWRIESRKLIAGLAHMVRDIGIAEELAQDALLAALEQWPASGVPRNPAAWLMAAAKHRAIDHFRRLKRLERKHEELGYELEADRGSAVADFDAALDDDVGDDQLRLVFTACHPVLSTEARVALTLRLIGGLTTEEIARAFLVPESTIAQRIVRAKRTLARERVPFELPRAAIVRSGCRPCSKSFTSSSTRATRRRRRRLDAAGALRRRAAPRPILAGLVPDEPEVHGLVALMEEYGVARGGAGRAVGEPILLLDQNRGRSGSALDRTGAGGARRAERRGGLGGP